MEDLARERNASSPRRCRCAFPASQEALNNVAKHAHAQHVWLRVEADATHMTLAVRDDGKGFDPKAPERAPRASA